jgi:hypothetical protein
MFPNNVERLVLDGVVDAPDYYATGWSKNLLRVYSLLHSSNVLIRLVNSDTDKVLDYFYASCTEAGPQECALYEETPDAIKARVEKIFDDLKYKPLPVVIGDGPQDYGVVDYGMVRETILNKFLYFPFTFGGKNASIILSSLEQGDGSPLYKAQLDDSGNLQCSPDGGSSQGTFQQATIAIMCSDGDQVNDTLSDLQKWFENNRKESTFADVWTHRIICSYVTGPIMLDMNSF